MNYEQRDTYGMYAPGMADAPSSGEHHVSCRQKNAAATQLADAQGLHMIPTLEIVDARIDAIERARRNILKVSAALFSAPLAQRLKPVVRRSPSAGEQALYLQAGEARANLAEQ